GFFSPKDPRWVAEWRILKQWRQYMARDLTSTDMTKAFVTQRAAMWWAASPQVNRLARDPDIDFRWGIFYLPPIPRSFCKYAGGREQCVIGGSGTQYSITNSAISDMPADMPFEQRVEKSQRLQRVVQFLQFLT